jgi:hypothetical protein
MSDALPYTSSELARSPQNPPSLSVPRHLARRLLWLPDKARNMGIALRGGKGSGKSTLMGMLAWLDFVRGVPLVVIDPVGTVIDSLLYRICRLPREYQNQLWPRVLYADMSGNYGFVVPFPMYYRLENESLYSISQRYPDAIRRVDPWLNTASIQGFNSLWKIATYTGMALAALDCQITEAEDLLRNPQDWLPHMAQAVIEHPELRSAVDFLQEYSQWGLQPRTSRTEAFRTKIAPFNLDPALRAMHGSHTPGVQWNEVVQNAHAVLLDFRHLRDHETRRFELIWSLHYFLDYLRHRGAGRQHPSHKPIALYIDELASLFHMQSIEVSPLREDLDELINMRMRSHMIWLCVAYQEAYQLDERTQKTLLTLGTQILGSTSDMDSALATAKQFFPVDPYEVKRYERVYGSMFGMPTVLDQRPIEFTVEEQHLLASYKVKEQPAFHFLVRPAQGEGDVTGEVLPVTIRNFDKGLWVNEQLVVQARELLSKKCGVPVASALSEIDSRRGFRETIAASWPIASAKMSTYGKAPSSPASASSPTSVTTNEATCSESTTSAEHGESVVRCERSIESANDEEILRDERVGA